MLGPTLQQIITDYALAKDERFAGHPTASFIRKEGATAVRNALGPLGANLLCVGSAGQGGWATIPWISVFNPLITTSATRGYYVVYLFSAVEPVVYLSLNQGTTVVQEEFNTGAYRVLEERARLMQARLAAFLPSFELPPIHLGSGLSLPRGYEAGHAFGKRYHLHTMPSEGVLREDLQRIVEAYLALTFLGGLEPSIDPLEVAAEAGLPADSLTIQEARRYKQHWRIERNANGAKLAKKLHGYQCQACCLNFEDQYGAIGKEFIEAHHLKPLSQLKEDTAENYDIATDFAVLCANCHRMIHRTPDPSDLIGFRRMLLSHRC